MIDLQKLIDSSNLSRYEIAIRLFPNNKFPEASLQRVIKRESYLDSEQIKRLSEMLDVPIEDLFSPLWRGHVKEKEHIFISGDYKAILNIENKNTRLFHNGSLIFETIFHSSGIALSEYIAMLNGEIEKHISNQ